MDNTKLTHFIPLVSFHTPWKHQKNLFFFEVPNGYRKIPVALVGKLEITAPFNSNTF